MTSAVEAVQPAMPPCATIICRLRRVRHQQALVAAVVGLADRRLHADLRRDAGHQQVGDAEPPELVLEIGVPEGALAGLVDDDLTRDRGDRPHDRVAGLALDEHPSARLVQHLADGTASPLLRRRQVAQVGLVRLKRVEHRHAGSTGGFQQSRGRAQRSLEQRNVVPVGVAEAPRLQEVALPINVEQAQPAVRGGERERLGRRHGDELVRRLVGRPVHRCRVYFRKIPHCPQLQRRRRKSRRRSGWRVLRRRRGRKDG
eukprot:scaffold22435_cov120-Isochrysis_galbana.AAC.2